MTARRSLEGEPHAAGPLGVDDRAVQPETRVEIIEGRLVYVPPSAPEHAIPHADLAYVLRAHTREGFQVAVDMLTRSNFENDFAPDASVFEITPDPAVTRQLEQLAFEIVNRQSMAEATTKARILAQRGVRRVFALVVKRQRVIEWSSEDDTWATTPLESIDDALFVRPLPTKALLEAAAADTAVLQAWRERGHPELDAVREEGREEGRAAEMRKGLIDLCEAYGIELDAPRTSHIAAMTTIELEALRATVKRDRRWP